MNKCKIPPARKIACFYCGGSENVINLVRNSKGEQVYCCEYCVGYSKKTLAQWLCSSLDELIDLPDYDEGDD